MLLFKQKQHKRSTRELCLYEARRNVYERKKRCSGHQDNMDHHHHGVHKSNRHAGVLKPYFTTRKKTILINADFSCTFFLTMPVNLGVSTPPVLILSTR